MIRLWLLQTEDRHDAIWRISIGSAGARAVRASNLIPLQVWKRVWVQATDLRNPHGTKKSFNLLIKGDAGDRGGEGGCVC